MENSPLKFSFTVEHGMSESDIKKLWDDTITAQNAMDRFLNGEFSEQEMTDLLDLCEIGLEETASTLENNLIIMGCL